MDTLYTCSFDEGHGESSPVQDTPITSLDDIVLGREYDLDRSMAALEKFKLNDHLIIKMGDEPLRLPIGGSRRDVEEIYIRVNKSGVPFIVTIANGRPQTYYNCAGHFGVDNFGCDSLIVDIFGLDSTRINCDK